MICKNCGLESSGVAFCPNCGTRLEEAQPVVVEEQKGTPGKGKGIVSLILGIVALASNFCCCFGGPVGIASAIVSLILGKAAKRAAEAEGLSNGPAKVGTILATIGLILMALSIIGGVAYYIIMIALGLGGSGYDDYYYYYY